MRTVLSLVATLLVALAAANAYDLATDQSGIYVVAWEQGSIPMQLKVPSTNVFSDGTTYASTIAAAMQVWNAQIGAVQFTQTTTDTPVPAPAGTYKLNNHINEIAFDSTYDGTAFGTNVLAITVWYYSGNNQREADVIFNTAWTWDSYRGSLSGHNSMIDVRRVAIHELGHALGLNHPDQATPKQDQVAIMRSQISSIDTVQPDDIAGAQLLYGSPGFVPTNDSFANATTVTLAPAAQTLTGTNVGASREAGEPNHAGTTSSGHSVWWKWTAPSTASATITTLGSNFDTVLSVYTGNAVAALTPVASNDDVQSGVIRTSAVTFNAVAGTVYRIAVDGWGTLAQGDAYTYTGAITLNVTLAVDVPPVVTTQPLSQSVVVGRPVTFSVAASGTPVPTYQWQKNGGNIPGATGATFTISSVSTVDAGNYGAVATNAAGTATSSAAVLTVTVGTSPGSADFNRDGKADLIWQNTTTGERSFWLMNGTSLQQGVSLGTFAPDWSIAGMGDFNQDGQTDLIWQNTITGDWSIWLMNGTNLSEGVALAKLSTDLTVAGTGDFNSDGRTDIVWQRVSTGERFVMYMNGTTPGVQAPVGTLSVDWSIAGVGDFNRDGMPDLVWQNAATGETSITLMNGVTVTSSITFGLLSRQLQVVGTGDYNGDGQIDLVWTDISTGARTVWLMSGTTRVSTATLGTVSPDWSLGRPIFLITRTARADFNSDGKTDIVWQNTATGLRTVTLMNGTTVSSTVTLTTVAPNWVIAAIGDFNRDEKPDLVWTDTATGERAVWLMNGTTQISSQPLGTIPLNWIISAAGDFNYDGKADLVWTNTLTGERSLWLMNGTVFGSGIALGTVPPEWEIAIAVDLNADGKTDLVWQNINTGERSVWLLNGGRFSAGVTLPTTPVAWSIVGSGDFNADGKADLLLQNIANGQRVVWLMNGTSYGSTVSIGTYSTQSTIRN